MRSRVFAYKPTKLEAAAHLGWLCPCVMAAVINHRSGFGFLVLSLIWVAVFAGRVVFVLFYQDAAKACIARLQEPNAAPAAPAATATISPTAPNAHVSAGATMTAAATATPSLYALELYAQIFATYQRIMHDLSRILEAAETEAARRNNQPGTDWVDCRPVLRQQIVHIGEFMETVGRFQALAHHADVRSDGAGGR
ncbi:hypothetical protein KEM55_002328 [Ascosphaera atra]|nr:hypothetical protein KEM55_002328 [Ascosphaera atra]